MGEAQRGFGSSAAAQAFKNKARLNTLEGTGKSYQSQENTNAQIRNAANMARQEAGMKEAMMNNEISKYNLENVYGYDTMTTAQKNAITAMLGNTAGQTFGKQTDYANQMEQANILSNQYDPSVLNDMIKNGKLKVVDGKIVRAEYGGMIKRSFRNGGTNNPGFNALPESVQENILNNMYSMGGRLMNDPMFDEGGITTKNTLGLTGDYSRSNTPQNILSNYNLKADYARKFGDFNAGLNANLGFENTLPMKPEEVSVMRPNANIGVNLNYERPTSNFGTTFNYNPLNQDINANLTYRKRFAEGGKLPKNVLQSRLEAHMSPEEINLYLNEYGDGGIHIKPENKGKFTAYAKSHGKGVQEMASAVLANKENYSPTIVKRANFAKNAAGWKHENGGYVEYAEGGNVNPYNQTLNKVTNFNTSKASEQMDAEYAAALAANKDKYTSSVTGLDYKVIKTLPKNEKRALVMDMWRDTHGEAPTQKQIESGVKAIEGKKVSSAKAKEVANVAKSQESMQDIISKKWTTGTYTPAASEPEGPSMMERGEQFYEEQILPAARTLKKNFKEGVEKGYDDLKDVYGKAKAMGKKAYASLENADYSGLPDLSSNARMKFEGNKIIQEDLDDIRKTVIPSSLRALAKDISNKHFGTKFKIDETHFTKSQLAEIEKLATGKLKESELSKSTSAAINSYNDYNKFSSDTTTINKNQFSDTKNIRNTLGKFNPENKDNNFVIKEWYDFNEKGKNTENLSFDEWYEYWKDKGYSKPLAAVRSIGSRFGSAPGENNTPIDVKIKKRSLKK
jgi:hypothetical protein